MDVVDPLTQSTQLRRLLSGLTDSELENLVRVGEEARPIPGPRRQREARPIPTPMRNVQQLILHFEANPIPPYRPIPAPRMKKNSNQCHHQGQELVKNEWF